MNKSYIRNKAYATYHRNRSSTTRILNDPEQKLRKSPVVSTHKARKPGNLVPIHKRQSRSKVLSRSALSKKRIKRPFSFKRVANHVLVGLFVVSNLMLGLYFVIDNSEQLTATFMNGRNSASVLSVSKESQLDDDSDFFGKNVVRDLSTGSTSLVRHTQVTANGEFLTSPSGETIAMVSDDNAIVSKPGRANVLYALMYNVHPNPFTESMFSAQKGNIIQYIDSDNSIVNFEIVDISEVVDFSVQKYNSDLQNSSLDDQPGLSVVLVRGGVIKPRVTIIRAVLDSRM